MIDLTIGDMMLKAVVESPFPAGVGDTVYLTFDPETAAVLDSASDQFIAYGEVGTPLWEASAALA